MHGGYLYDGAFPQALASVRLQQTEAGCYLGQRRNRLLLFAPTCAPAALRRRRCPFPLCCWRRRGLGWFCTAAGCWGILRC